MNDSQYQPEETARKSSKLCTASMIVGIIADVLLFFLVIFWNEYMSSFYRFLGISGSTSWCREIGGNKGDFEFILVYSVIGLVMLICSLIGAVLAICSLVSGQTKKNRALIGLLCDGIAIGVFLLYCFLSSTGSGGGGPSLPPIPLD